MGVPANNATADIALTAFGATAGTLVGNTFVRNSGGGDFTSAVRGPLMAGASCAEMDIVAAAINIIELDTSPTTTADSTQVLYAQYDPSSGVLILENSGSLYLNANIGGGITGKMQVFYDRVRFRVFLGGAQFGPIGSLPPRTTSSTPSGSATPRAPN